MRVKNIKVDDKRNTVCLYAARDFIDGYTVSQITRAIRAKGWRSIRSNKLPSRKQVSNMISYGKHLIKNGGQKYSESSRQTSLKLETTTNAVNGVGSSLPELERIVSAIKKINESDLDKASAKSLTQYLIKDLEQIIAAPVEL